MLQTTRTLRCAALGWGLVMGLVGGVGALDCAPTSQSLALKTTKDVTYLIGNCTTFHGNLVVAADGPSTIDLSGLTTITGNLDVENVAALASLSSSTLTNVASFTLNNLPKLSNLSFPALNNFSSLKWYDLPKLEETVIATGALVGEIQGISILNTSLKSLDWLTWPIGSQLNISHNDNLESFAIPYAKINAGSALVISSNSKLSSLDVSQVTGIYGGLALSENGASLSSLDFEVLVSINGYVQLKGAFTNISMPALSGINGALTVVSTADVSSFCASLDGSKGKLDGHYDCTSNLEQKPVTTGTATAAAAATSTSTSTSTSAADSEPTGSRPAGTLITNKQKAGIAVAAILFTFLVCALAFFYFRRRSQRKIQEIIKQNSTSRSLSSGSSLSHRDLKGISTDTDEFTLPDNPSFVTILTPTTPAELESPIMRIEMPTAAQLQYTEGAVEMEGSHGISEVERGPERFELPA